MIVAIHEVCMALKHTSVSDVSLAMAPALLRQLSSTPDEPCSCSTWWFVRITSFLVGLEEDAGVVATEAEAVGERHLNIEGLCGGADKDAGVDGVFWIVQV